MKLPPILVIGKSSLLAFALAAATLDCPAAVLVYEGYDYALASGTDIVGQTAIGQGLTGAYAVSTAATNGTNTMNYVDGSLAFGDHYLPTSGGKLEMRSQGTGSGANYIVQVGLDSAMVNTQHSVLYNSYLVNFQSLSTGPTSGSPVNFGLWLDPGTATNRLMNMADIRPQSVSANRPGVRYGASTVNTVASGSLSTGVTYLVLARYTNVGMAGGGTATQFVFTLSGYEDWLTLGGGEESTLGTYAAFTATATNSNKVDIGRMVFQVSGRNGTERGYLDEIRWGTTLGSVVAIPEPATFALLAGGLGVLVLLRRRRSVVSFEI